MSFASELSAPRAQRALFLLTFILLCAAGAAAQTASFAGRDYPIVGNTQVAADFNGDGRPDLAGAGSNVRVALNAGDGSFRPFVEYPAGGFTQDVAAGDLNGDGRLDLVVTNNSQQVALTVLLGNGDGTFGAAVSYPNDTGFDSPSVALGDFDGDGRLDAVAAHQINCFGSACIIGESVSLWRGIGDGSFQAPQQLNVGFAPARVAAADLNNDGNLDLAVAGGDGGVFILLGAGDGTFRQMPDLSVVPGTDNTDIAVGEFNGDSIPDLAIAAEADSRTVVVLGNGDGTFRPSASVSDALSERPGELTVADLNGDGSQDVLLGMANCCTTNGDGMLGVLYGTGAGTFQPVTRYLVPGFVVGRGGGALIASDFNGDGRQDVALQVRGNSPGTTVLVNTTGSAPAAFALGSVVLTPPSVVGGTQAEVNVLLAPGSVAQASTTLTVTSSRTSVATVPSSVRVIAGMTNVRFTVNTASVTSTQTVTINVSSGRGGSRSATLTVTPAGAAALGSLQTQPSSVFGGTNATGVVSLTPGTVAPSGGAVVSLTNDNPGLVSTPLNVNIPAGQSSASFNIATQQTGLTTAVQITATYAGVSKSATLTVNAPSNGASVASVTLTPSAVVGGSAQTVRVQVGLDRAAPPEGATITLSSSDPNVVRLPQTLGIAPGGTSGFADFTTAAVSAPTQVTVRATYGGSTQTALLTVNPAPAPAVTLAAVAVSPSAVTGGSNAQGTVTLSGPAQSATVVNLSSSSAVASVPASVTVPAGASSAAFAVATTSVASSTSVTINAVSGSVTRTALLTVNPAAAADTVSVQKAEYNSSKGTLLVEASSTRSDATLQVFVTSTGQLLGTLTNRGGGKSNGQLSAATNPQNITVRSNLGGSATRAVLAK
ncbi:MAG: VCBS repeat-containing protein [Acidobacteria bacterium]|nr:VCBS repeat-containing protein [Acidobacteriota bacterium]